MKISEVYPSAAKSKPKQEPPKLDKEFQYEIGKGLCRRGSQIWLNHKWGPGWICTRCGGAADIKGLLHER